MSAVYPRPISCRDGIPARAEKSCRSALTESEALSRLVIKALWAAFPDAKSEEAVAEAAAPYFRNKKGEPISPRTVRYWLQGETLPSAVHLSALVMMQPKIFLTSWIGK